MLYFDISVLPEIRARADACVSIYVSTAPQTQQVKASRIALANRTKAALQRLAAAGFDKRRQPGGPSADIPDRALLAAILRYPI